MTTNAIKEWVAAAGVWTPQDRRHALPILYKDDPNTGFELPPETENIDPEKHPDAHPQAEPRRMVPLDEFMGGPPGLTWERTDTEPPTGHEMKSIALATALESCVCFTKDEWANFGVHGFLREDHFIKSGESLSDMSV